MKKIIIVGGGIAGLSAGIYARLAGYEAEIYEKNMVPGGECMGWKRKGLWIDNCIHWLTGTKKDTALYNVWKTVGALSDDTRYAPISEFYTSTFEGRSATLWNDLDRTEQELLEASPQDEKEIKKFIEHVRYAQQCEIPAEKPMEMMAIRDYVRMGAAMKDMPKVMKEYGSLSLNELGARFKSPLLQHLMTDYLPAEYTAYSLLVSYATMASGNGNIPMGGSLAMSQRMAKRFSELGGKLFLNCAVESIIVEKHRATGIKLKDGTVHSADFIIPAVDYHVLFSKLLSASYMPRELKRAYENPEQYPVTSGFQAAYAVDCSFCHGDTVFIDCEPFMLGKRKVTRLYIKFYGYDPIFVNEGKTVLQMNISQDHRDFEFWKSLSAEEYKQTKEQLSVFIMKQIILHFPELRDKMEILDCWTPLTYERYCGAYHGAYMSFVTIPGAKQLKLKGQIAGISNLYLAGQWANSPGGLPIAVTSGKFAIQRLEKSRHRKF